MFDSISEKCGVFGIYSEETADVASAAYYHYLHFNTAVRKVAE